MQLFRERRDPYNNMASDIFGRPIDRKYQDEHGDYPDFLEGFIGKTATLGLGYQMGGPKFMNTVIMNAKVQLNIEYDITLEEAYRIVDIYRRKNYMIVEFWERCREMLIAMCLNSAPYDFEYADGVLHVDTKENKIWFPNGTYLFYPCLSYDEGNFTYVTKLGSKYVNRYTYGGKTAENIVQKFARDIVQYQMKAIAEHDIPIVLQTYDENVGLVKKSTAERDYQLMVQLMKTPPPWAATLPLDAEGGVAKEYSK